MLDHRSIMSGQRKDPIAIAMRVGLGAASVPYRVAVQMRNRRFDTGAKLVHRCDVPVVSVGNLTTGGTGKTPIVCYLSKWFRQRGVRAAIVSRGYGRGEASENDEALELHARLPDVPHVQDPDRVEAARIATAELDAQLILMDDGFQHRRLHRDLNLLVIDAHCPFGYGHLLPRGLLREPVSGIKRADLVMITRCDTVDAAILDDIQNRVHAIDPNMPIVRTIHQPGHLLTHPDQLRDVDALQRGPVATLSAIGNPEAFEQTVRACGGDIVDSMRLPDHDRYSPETVAKLTSWIQSLGDRVKRIVCTHKDLVKLRCDRLGGKPLVALMIDLKLVSDASPLETKLNEVLTLIDHGES